MSEPVELNTGAPTDNRTLQEVLGVDPNGGHRDSQHPKALEWRCTCKLRPDHAGPHTCYVCGFEWSSDDPQHVPAPTEGEKP